MTYDIIKTVAPKMLSLSKGTECIKILLSQASKDMHDPLFRCFSLSLACTSTARNFSIPTSFGRNHWA